MKSWFLSLLFIAILGYAKAHHFVKLVILAGLGLAGLWMVHTLAQDYNKIQSSGGDTRIFKRSATESSYQINWEAVLSRDPVSCARSFLCQMAAEDKKLLSKEELLMLELSRTSAEKETWSGRQLREALNNGEKVKQPVQCMRIYKYCPYDSQTMLKLLRIFGG